MISRQTAITQRSRCSEPTVDGSLGALTIRASRQSFIINVTVTHEDLEAAGLIANRYVREWMAELTNSTNFAGLSVRELDVATPPRDPVFPNRQRIFRESLGLAVITFIGLMVVATLLRKLVQTRWGNGPQWKVG